MTEGERVKLWVHVDDWEVGLMFTWIGDRWVCELSHDLMKELGPLPIEQDDGNT